MTSQVTFGHHLVQKSRFPANQCSKMARFTTFDLFGPIQGYILAKGPKK